MIKVKQTLVDVGKKTNQQTNKQTNPCRNQSKASQKLQ